MTEGLNEENQLAAFKAMLFAEEKRPSTIQNMEYVVNRAEAGRQDTGIYHSQLYRSRVIFHPL